MKSSKNTLRPPCLVSFSDCVGLSLCLFSLKPWTGSWEFRLETRWLMFLYITNCFTLACKNTEKICNYQLSGHFDSCKWKLCIIWIKNIWCVLVKLIILYVFMWLKWFQHKQCANVWFYPTTFPLMFDQWKLLSTSVERQYWGHQFKYKSMIQSHRIGYLTVQLTKTFDCLKFKINLTGRKFRLNSLNYWSIQFLLLWKIKQKIDKSMIQNTIKKNITKKENCIYLYFCQISAVDDQ